MSDHERDAGPPEGGEHGSGAAEDEAVQPRATHPGAEALEEFAAAAADAPPRARRRTARPRGRTIHGGEASAPKAQARVRGAVEEGPAGSDGPSPDAASAGEEPTMLDGAGSPLAPPPPPPAASGAAAGQEGSAGAHVVDPAVFLVAAVRSYLDGLDAHGPAHPVTEDRLLRLRDTLARFDDEQPS